MNPPLRISILATIVWFMTAKDDRLDDRERLRNTRLTKNGDLGGSGVQFPEDGIIEGVRLKMVDETRWEQFQKARAFFKELIASGDLWSPDCEVKANHILGIANLEASVRLEHFVKALAKEALRDYKDGIEKTKGDGK